MDGEVNGNGGGTAMKNRRAHLYWAVFFVAVIMAHLWWLRSWLGTVEFFLPVLAVMLTVNYYFGEGPSKIGFWPQDFKKCFHERFEQLVGLSLLLIWWTVLSGNVANLADYDKAWFYDKASFLRKYILVGLAQQYILNGFFVNRLISFYGDEKNKSIPLVAGLMFGLVHLPNWFLMMVTFAGGYFCAKVFIEHRNLYFLGLAHGLVAFLLFHAFPDSITHHFVVGIKYFSK